MVTIFLTTRRYSQKSMIVQGVRLIVMVGGCMVQDIINQEG